MVKKIVIIGAAGMDYHIFNRVFRDKKEYEVLAFTMCVEQNLGTTGEGLRTYPPCLAGSLYPKGIPTIAEHDLTAFIKEKHVDVVVIAYSDLSYDHVGRKAAVVLAAGADFWCISPKNTMIKANKPIVAVCAVRTGCGKSQTSLKVYQTLQNAGKKVVAIREPMPYGDLEQQTCMRIATWDDLIKYKCTVEEREEYEQYVERGLIIYSGVDYEKIIREAEKEADVIVWDGGNNEVSFYVPDILFVVCDPLRAGHEIRYYPGEVNVRTATHLIVNKENSATQANIDLVVKNLKDANPKAVIIHSNSEVTVDEKDIPKIKGKKVLVVEDGPTLTHGDMGFGAGTVAAKKYGAQMIDPKPYLQGSVKAMFEEFKHLDSVIPAMGYNEQQIKDLKATIEASKCDIVLSGTPFDLAKLLKINKDIIRVGYAIVEKPGSTTLAEVLKKYTA